MKASIQDGPGATEDAIHRSREPRTERLHAARERPVVERLDDQVNVIALQRVMDYAEIAALAALPQTAPELTKKSPTTKARHVAA
jgi:hypothetical protein